MATPRISWDVSVSGSLQTGTWLTRWEEESSSSQVLFFKVDQYGFYLAWREDDKEGNCLDLCSVSEVRIGGVPKDTKLRDMLQNEGADILEDRSFTLVYGQNLVDVSYLHLCADSSQIADEWISGLRPLLHNLKMYNASILTQLLKLYVKLGHLASTSGKIAVKSICKCLNVGKYEQRVLEGLEAMKLPHGKNDELDHKSFTFEQFYQLYLKVCARFEIEQLCLKCGGKGLSLNVNQLVNFLNQEQRDPRLNEILYPYYDKERALSLIWKYEKSLDNLQRDRITVNGLTRYLLSEDNILMMPNRIEVYQDMTQPLSHYFINSSHNTYLVGRQFGGKSSVEMYRQCLLAGCRCIELDCWDGPGDDPIITHGKAMCTNILFKDVIEAIHDSAFTTSEYPVILSFENHCSKSQQYKMACYCSDIFGDMLLTKPLDSHPLEEGKSLPSPSHLKKKIIIKNKKLKPEQESEAESFYDFSEIGSDFETTDTSALRVGSIKETAIIDDDIEEEDNVEENNHDEISQNFSSPELDNQSVTSEDLNKILEYSERVCNDLLQESTVTAVEESLTNNKVVTLEDIKQYSSVLISKILNEAGLNGLERDYVSDFDGQNSIDSQVVALVANDCSSEGTSVSQTSSRTSEEVDGGFHSQKRLSEISFTSTLSAGSEVSTDSDSENLASVLTPTVTVTASGETTYDLPSLKEINSSTEVMALHKPFRINGGLESIQEVSDLWENGEDLRHIDDSDNISSKSERTKFYIDFQPEENTQENGKESSGVLQCNGNMDLRRTQSALQGTHSDSPATQSSMRHARDLVCNDQRIASGRKESNASTQSMESNPDEEEERDIVNEYRKREEKLAIFGSSLKLNMGGKKGSRAASLTPEDWEAFSQFTSNYQTTGNIHPYLSSLVNYIHPVPFNGFDEAEKKNMCHLMSSFNESTGFGLLKASPVEFVKYNKRQLSRIYPKGSRVDSSNYMPQVFWNVGCQMVSLNFQTSDLAFQLNDGKFEYNARCGYILKPDLMRRSDRLFDPFTESVIDGMVAASVIVKVVSGQFLSDKKISTYVEVDMYGLPTDTLRKKYKTKLVPNNGMDPAYGDFEDDKINFEFKRVVLPELALLRFAVMDDNDKLVAQRVVPLDGLQSGFRHISLRTENNFPMPLATLFCQIILKTYIPERYTDIVDELSEPIKYRSAADKRAAQMVVFGIDEIEDDSNVPPFLKTSASCGALSKIKAPSLTSINNSTAVCNVASSRARESIVTLSYSGTRSASEITLIESNLPKKYDFKFSPVIAEELKKDKTFIKVFKKHQKENEALTKRYTKERTAMQRVHTAELEKLITNYEKIKIAAIRRFDRVVRRSEDERSDELRKVHESQMLYLNKTQTDKAKEKLSLQTEEWTNMINRQVEEQIGIYEQQAEMQLETLKKVMDTAHEGQLKEVGARHEKENTEITKRQTRQSIESVRALLLDKSIKSKEERDRRQRELDKQNLKRFYDERETLSDRQKREIEELKNQQKEEKNNLDAEYRKIMADHMDEIKTNGEKSRKAIHTAFQTILPSH